MSYAVQITYVSLLWMWFSIEVTPRVKKCAYKVLSGSLKTFARSTSRIIEAMHALLFLSPLAFSMKNQLILTYKYPMLSIAIKVALVRTLI
jgi:hypothetical protein